MQPPRGYGRRRAFSTVDQLVGVGRVEEYQAAINYLVTTMNRCPGVRAIARGPCIESFIGRATKKLVWPGMARPLGGCDKYQVQTKTLQPGSNWEILDVIEDTVLAVPSPTCTTMSCFKLRCGTARTGGANQQFASNEVEMTLNTKIRRQPRLGRACSDRPALGVPVEVRVNVGEGYQGHEYELQRLNKDTDHGQPEEGHCQPRGVSLTTTSTRTNSRTGTALPWPTNVNSWSQSQEAETMLLQGFEDESECKGTICRGLTTMDFPRGRPLRGAGQNHSRPFQLRQPLETMDANRPISTGMSATGQATQVCFATKSSPSKWTGRRPGSGIFKLALPVEEPWFAPTFTPNETTSTIGIHGRPTPQCWLHRRRA